MRVFPSYRRSDDPCLAVSDRLLAEHGGFPDAAATSEANLRALRLRSSDWVLGG